MAVLEFLTVTASVIDDSLSRPLLSHSSFMHVDQHWPWQCSFITNSAPQRMTHLSSSVAALLLFAVSASIGSAQAFSFNPLATLNNAAPTTASPAPIKTPVVICPGFGNDSIDYLTPLSQPREAGFISALERRGFENISTVPVKRSDWVRVAGGLLDMGFYTNSALPTGRGYGWYIKRLKECVDIAYEESGGERVLLIGHSAGGWLARAAMGDGTWDEATGVRTADRVRCLATIGAIHKEPATAGSCVTRGALAYTNEMYPGAYLAGEGTAYVSVGGDAIVGNSAKDMPEDATDADMAYAVRGEGNAQRVAYTSYEAVCGEGEVTGDGVVPLAWSELPGARHVPLEGVLHSINEAGTTIPTDRWYGADGVVDRWLPAVLEEAGIINKKAGLGDLAKMFQFAQL